MPSTFEDAVLLDATDRVLAAMRSEFALADEMRADVGLVEMDEENGEPTERQ